MTGNVFVQSRMDVGNRVSIFRTGIIGEQRQRRERKKKEKKRRRNRFHRCERRIEKRGEENRSGRHNLIVFQKCGKKKRTQGLQQAAGLDGRSTFFRRFFLFHFSFLLSFFRKNGVNVAHTQSSSLSVT